MNYVGRRRFSLLKMMLHHQLDTLSTLDRRFDAKLGLAHHKFMRRICSSGSYDTSCRPIFLRLLELDCFLALCLAVSAFLHQGEAQCQCPIEPGSDDLAFI